jgi:Sulfotransferase family
VDLPSMPNPDDPFVLVSASFHRSGSTWLQRVIAAGSDSIVWGETGNLVPELRRATELWRKRAPIADQERTTFLNGGMAPDIWIANMSPSEAEFVDGQRALFRRLYSQRYGRSRWGWKAVTYAQEDIRHVWDLFPALKVILLVRDVANVYRSLRTLSWHTGWPGGPREIAKLWAERSKGYATLAEDPRALFLKYEETRTRIADLVGFLGMNYDQHLVRALDTELSTTTETSLSKQEREELVIGAGDALQCLQYPLPA